MRIIGLSIQWEDIAPELLYNESVLKEQLQ